MIKITLLLALFLALIFSATIPPPFDLSKVLANSRMFTMAAPPSLGQPTSDASTVKKGTTWQVTEWPIETNSWAAKAGFSTIDNKNGDTLCTEKLPLLCLIDYKTIPRPKYNFVRDVTGKSVVDGGFYNGWTGGYFAATDSVLGTDLANRNVADKICQGRFGASARVLEQSLPLFMEYMNDLPNVG